MHRTGGQSRGCPFGQNIESHPANEGLLPTGNELRSERRQIDNEAGASPAAQSVNLQGVRFAQPVGKEDCVLASLRQDAR
jgi:hypothetical protein